MDSELNLFKSLDEFLNLLVQRHPDLFTQFHSFYDYVKVMKQRDPNSFAQFNDLGGYSMLLNERDPSFSAQFIRLERLFRVMKHRDPNSFALELAKRLATPSVYTVHYREVYAHFLWRLLTKDRDFCTWRDLPVSTQSNIKTTLLDRIMKEEPNFIITALRATVVKLAPSLISGNNCWPELLPCLYQCVTSSTSHNCAKIEAFTIFAELAEKIGETMFSSLKDSLHPVLRKTLYGNAVNMDVRVAAMVASTNIILCVSSSNEKERFQYLVPGMMMTLTDRVSSTEEQLFFPKKLPLSCLLKLSTREPRFLRMQLVDVVSTVLDIVEAECLEEEARHEGVRFLLTLVEAKEKAPGMVKKLPLFIGRCFAMLLNLLVLSIEDDPAWYNAESVYEWGTRAFHFGFTSLRGFSCALGSKSVAHEAKEQLSASLAAPEWKKRYAALCALAAIAEGCSEACATGVLGIICKSMKSEDLMPHLDGTVNKLLELLQKKKQVVQREALSSLRFTALSVEEHFRTYYDTVMPHLIAALRNTDLKSDRCLHASVLVCISSIGEAVGKEKFREDTKQIIEVLMPLQELQEWSDEPYTWIMLRACLRICRCMGQEFLLYVTAVIPFLIQCAEWHDKNHGVDDNSIAEVVMFRDKTLRKCPYGNLNGKLGNACHAIGECANILEEDFYPWIPKVLHEYSPERITLSYYIQYSSNYSESFNLTLNLFW